MTVGTQAFCESANRPGFSCTTVSLLCFLEVVWNKRYSLIFSVDSNWWGIRGECKDGLELCGRWQFNTEFNWHHYTSNWQISYRAHNLIWFRLPTLNLHLQAVLQPTSTVAPLFSFINVMPEVTHTNAATRFPLRSLAINKCNPSKISYQPISH